MSRRTWRMRFAPQIDTLIRKGHTLADQEGRRAFRAGWKETGLGAKNCWPYKVWRHELRVQLGLIPRSRKRAPHRSGLQLVLPEVAEERAHGE